MKKKKMVGRGRRDIRDRHRGKCGMKNSEVLPLPVTRASPRHLHSSVGKNIPVWTPIYMPHPTGTPVN